MEETKPDARLSLLMTGDELIRSTIVDTNAGYLAGELSNIGLPIFQKVTVGDDTESIATALRYLSANSDIVVVNGGLGATSDDRTVEAVAAVSGKKLVESEEATKQVERNYRRMNRDIDIARIPRRIVARFTTLPESAEIIDNDTGIAVGFKLKISRAICYFTPGVPNELKPMFRHHIAKDIQRTWGRQQSAAPLRIQFFGLGESVVEQKVLKRLEEERREVRIGLRAHAPYVDVGLAFSANMDETRVSAVESKMRTILPQYSLPGNRRIAHEVVRLLRERKKRLAIAESCTGGMAASLLTAVPGASEVFETGVVAYSNRAKIQLLGVSKQAIASHGAVSAQVVKQMVAGLLERAEADCGIAVSGVAGPAGGTPEKPVGTVYIGWGSRSEISVRRLYIKRPRAEFQALTAAVSLDLMRRHLLDYDLTPGYFFDILSQNG